MFSFVLETFCCCGTRKHNGTRGEQERLLQFEIPTSPPQPLQPRDFTYRERMGTIVRNMEGKMVNLSSRLPFNLHRRVMHDSLGSASRSNSVCYEGFDYFERSNDSNDVSNRHLNQENPREDAFTYTYHPYSRSHSVSDRQRPTSEEREEREIDRPPAILNLRLVGVTENERGRALERTAKPTGLGGGGVIPSGNQLSRPHNSADDAKSGPDARPASIALIDPKDMVLSSWYE